MFLQAVHLAAAAGRNYYYYFASFYVIFFSSNLYSILSLSLSGDSCHYCCLLHGKFLLSFIIIVGLSTPARGCLPAAAWAGNCRTASFSVFLGGGAVGTSFVHLFPFFWYRRTVQNFCTNLFIFRRFWYMESFVQGRRSFYLHLQAAFLPTATYLQAGLPEEEGAGRRRPSSIIIRRTFGIFLPACGDRRHRRACILPPPTYLLHEKEISLVDCCELFELRFFILFYHFIRLPARLPLPVGKRSWAWSYSTAGIRLLYSFLHR